MAQENSDKNTNSNSNSNTNARNVNDVSAIVKMCEKMIQEAVVRTNDLRAAESERINQMFTSHKEYYDSKFVAEKDFNQAILRERDAKLSDKFESLATAINKAEVATEKRFESVNEFRAQLSDQQKTFLTANEYKSAHQNLLDLVSTSSKTTADIILTQKERIDKIDNIKQGGSQMWILIVGVIGICMGIASFIINILTKIPAK